MEPRPLVRDFRVTPMDSPIGVFLPERLDWTVVQASNENLVDRKGSEVHKFRHWLKDVYVRITPPKKEKAHEPQG
jgi:hypothetical protein